MRDQRRPVLAGRVDARGRDELEVPRAAALIRDDEETVAALLAPVVLDRVFVAVIARRDDAWLGVRHLGRHEPHFGSELRRGLDEDEATAAGAFDPDEEALVVLAVHEHVVGGRGAERMAPDLERAHRVVGACVEARARVVGPREAVGHVVDRVGEVLSGRDVAEAERVPLAAGHVDRVREGRMVRRDLEAAEREVVVAIGEPVLVENDVRQLRALAPESAAVDRVLRTLQGPGRVLPPALGDGCGLVGLLHARLDLVEDAVPERQQGREHRVGVGILGFEVGDDLRVVTVAEPVPVVAALVAVRGQDVGIAPGRRRVDAGCGRIGSGHRRASLNAAGRRFATATISSSCRR